MIAELSEVKKWSKDPNIKFLYAFVELGEAVDAWKKRKPPLQSRRGNYQRNLLPYPLRLVYQPTHRP